MYKSRSTDLPPNEFSKERRCEVGYTFHGDDKITFVESGRRNTFVFAHGSRQILLACTVGYLSRLGYDEVAKKSLYTEAGRNLLGEISVDDYQRKPQNSYYYKSIMSGLNRAHFNNEQMGWDALCYPIPKQPGVLDEVGGSGVYSRTDVFGNTTMLFADVPSTLDRLATHVLDREIQQKPNAELYVYDIPSFAGLLIDSSLGEYRKEVAWLLRELVGE